MKKLKNQLGSVQEMEFNFPPSEKKLGRVFMGCGIFLFVFGLVLPSDWQHSFGMLSQPILWVAKNTPFIKKCASISPVSNIFQGFYGVAFILAPLFCAIMVFNDSILLRFKRGICKSTSKIKFIMSVYFFLIPFLLGFVCLIFFLPGQVHLHSSSRGGAGLIFFLMLSYRFSLALLGSVLIMFVCGALWFITVFLGAPFLYFFEKVNK